MKIKKKRFLSILVSLTMMIGLIPGMSITAQAAEETLLTTITATGSETASYSTENIATVSFEGMSTYEYGWTARRTGSVTVNAAEGYTITKCIFYSYFGSNITVTSAPFKVDFNGYEPQITKVDVYGYSNAPAGSDKTALNNAITAAETLYDSIKNNNDYIDIAGTLKTAIEDAKDVADSDTADQNAVDAATTAITTAKTNAEAAKKDVDDTTEANKVSDKISELPSKEAVTKNHKTAIDAAKAAFDALTDDQKAKVSDADKQKLNDAVEALAAIEKEEADTAAAKAVSDKIAALPAKEAVTKDNKEAIEAAKAAYDALTDDQKKKVSEEDKQKLTDAEDALEVAEVIATITALPAADDVTTADKTDIEAARAAYEALTPEQQESVNKDPSILAYLQTAEVALAIAELPAASEVTAKDKKDIKAARAAYEALTPEQKATISEDSLKKLKDAEDKLLIIETVSELVSDEAKAGEVTDKINNSLPATDEITLKDETKVAAARMAYELLTDAQKNLISEETLNKLEAAEKKISDLKEQAALEAAKKSAIERLQDYAGAKALADVTTDEFLLYDKAISEGIDFINEEEDIDGVALALGFAKQWVDDALATINSDRADAAAAATVAEQLAAAKKHALERLDDYSDAKAKADATKPEKTDFDKAVAEGIAAINAAVNPDAVAKAVTNAKRIVDKAAKKIDKDRAKVAKAKAKQVKLKVAIAKKNRKATVVWKQKTNINGYQIAYSTSKKFTKKTTKYMNAGKKATKKTLKKLKAGKQYFVKVRTYRVLYNPATGKTEKIFGRWSNVKTVLARK